MNHRTDTVGQGTRDLLTLGQPHPAEAGIDPHARETAMQRWGTRCMIGGITIIIGTYTASLVVAVLADTQAFHDPEARLFAVIGMVALIMLGTLLLGFGGWERLARYDRAQSRLQLANQLRILEQNQTTIDGQADMGRAIDMIAAHLPKTLELENWRGYNQAIKDGFLADTGTGGAPQTGRRRLHIAEDQTRG